MKVLRYGFKELCALHSIVLLIFLFLVQATGFSFEHILAIILMFAGSILLIFNRWIGSIVGSLPMVYYLILEMSSPSWINPTPYLLAVIAYYLICGAVVFKFSNK